jgi:hypothetical protein
MLRKPRLVILPPQHLGHEIHVGRCIVVDMICKGILDAKQGDFVMTGLPDRRFLYQSLMGVDNVVDFSIVPGMNQPITPPKTISEYLFIPSSSFNQISLFSNHQIINLSKYALPPTYCTFGTSDEMINVGYSVPRRYWNALFIELIQQFHLSNIEEINQIVPRDLPLYVIIHHRYNASTDLLKRIIHALPSRLGKVIFTSNFYSLQQHLSEENNLYFTDDLKTYCTLLHDTRCKLLISEWSGAGQIAQYILGTQGSIWYYYDHYPDIFNFTMTHKIWELNATLGNYFNCWDFKIASGCSSNHFDSLDSLIKSVENIRVD